MCKLKAVLLALVLAIFFTTNIAQASLAEQINRYSNTLRWQMPVDKSEQVINFTLRLDGKDFLIDIPNQNQINSQYVLRKNSEGVYSLNLITKLDPGIHTWQIEGKDASGQILIQSKMESFEVSGFFDYQSTLNKLMTAFAQHQQLIFSALAGLGTLLYLLFFLAMFLLDMLFAKGGNFAARINWQDKLKLKRTGYVYDSKTNQGIPFALITAHGRDSAGHEITITGVSDMYGVYDEIIVPKGMYQIRASKQNYLFPTRHTRPGILPKDDFYKGEVVRIAHAWQSLYPTIPLDETLPTSAYNQPKLKISDVLWQKWKSVGKKQGYFEVLLLIFSLFGYYFNPHWGLLLLAIIYSVFILARLISLIHTPNLVGRVIDQNGLGIKDAVVSVSNDDSAQRKMHSMCITDQKGNYSFHLKSGIYHLKAQKNGFLPSGTGLTEDLSNTVTIKWQRQQKEITLKPLVKHQRDFIQMLDEIAQGEQQSTAPIASPPHQDSI